MTTNKDFVFDDEGASQRHHVWTDQDEQEFEGIWETAPNVEHAFETPRNFHNQITGIPEFDNSPSFLTYKTALQALSVIERVKKLDQKIEQLLETGPHD